MRSRGLRPTRTSPSRSDREPRMNNCPLCFRAESERNHEYDKKCFSCWARYISTRPEFTESYKRHVITTPYRLLLSSVDCPEGFLALHRMAFAWHERQAPPAPSGFRCTLCGAEGHRAELCPNRKRRQQDPQEQTQ